MDFYEKINKDIDDLYSSKLCKKIINNINNNENDSIDEFIELLSLKYDYPQEILKLILEDKILFLKIIERYKIIIDTLYETNYSYEKIIKHIQKQLINSDTNNTNNLNKLKKEKYCKYNNIIYTYLEKEGWFETYYNDFIIPMEEPNLPLTNFKWRINQLDAINKLKENGLQTGIHCQATGTGKSYIIINHIDYINKNKKNPKIILFTERVNILKDLFDFNNGIPNMNKINEWVLKGIGDLTDFEIINRVTIKKKDWVEIFNKSKKPTLLLINRAFLTSNTNYKDLNNITCVIHDECHSSTSKLCHDFLVSCKNNNIPIIGFSATPLRTGKTDGEFNKDKLIEIFSKNNDNKKLNLITDYNMIFSIQNELILPPKFYWYNSDIDTSKDNDDKKNNVSQEELGSAFGILNDVVKELPNKKIIAWCGTIQLCKKWYELFNEYKSMFKNIKNIEPYIDYSTSTDKNNYEQFRTVESNAIMFCAMKHREGSDIQKLDCCIFLDKVKNRSPIPFIQSIGRVLRQDLSCPEKQCGYIIDGIVKEETTTSEEYDRIVVDKIFGYYFALANLSPENDNDKFNQYAKLRDIVQFNKEEEVINLKLHNLTIPIKCKKLEWKNIVSKFDKVLQNIIKITPEEAFNIIINKIKELKQFQNPDNDFWTEYEKLDHNKLNIPKDIYNEYKQIWENKTWYDILGFKNNFISLDNFKKKFCKKFPAIKNINESFYEKIKKDFNLPNYPFEFYRLEKITNYNHLL
jgi:superfamily II DNA or RNA helicase